MEATATTSESGDGHALVDVQAISDQQDRSTQVSEEISEKVDHPEAIDVQIRGEGKVKSYLSAGRGDGQRGDDRRLLAVTTALKEDRGLASGRPGTTDERRREEAALVQEDDMGPQPRGFFLMRGHSTLTQRRMASSSRSRARRSGFWGVQPRARSRRPI